MHTKHLRAELYDIFLIMLMCSRHVTVFTAFFFSCGVFLNIYFLVSIWKNTKVVEICEFENEYAGFLLNRNYATTTEIPVEEELNDNGTMQSALFAVQNGGGLGNNLFELVSLLGIADSLHRSPVINAIERGAIDKIWQQVQPMFPKFVAQFEFRLFQKNEIESVKLNFGPCCKYDDPEKLSKRRDVNLRLDGHYFQSFKYFHHLRPKIRQWLSPNRENLARAEMMLPVAQRGHFIICTHIRRGDFKTDGLHQPSDSRFTRLSTDYLVSKYQKIRNSVSVVLLGNDPIWSYSVFHDRVGKSSYMKTMFPETENLKIENSPEYKAILTPTLSPAIDLAFSGSLCDAVLITSPSSTFGWWLGYLSKPTSIVYYRDITEANDGVRNEMREEDFYPPDWIKLVTDEKTGKIRTF